MIEITSYREEMVWNEFLSQPLSLDQWFFRPKDSSVEGQMAWFKESLYSVLDVTMDGTRKITRQILELYPYKGHSDVWDDVLKASTFMTLARPVPRTSLVYIDVMDEITFSISPKNRAEPWLALVLRCMISDTSDSVIGTARLPDRKQEESYCAKEIHTDL